MFSISAAVKAATIEATTIEATTVEASIEADTVKETSVAAIPNTVVPEINIESPSFVTPHVSTAGRVELPIRAFSRLPVPVHLAELCVALGTGNDEVRVFWVSRVVADRAGARKSNYQHEEDAGAKTTAIGQFVFRLEWAWEVAVGAVALRFLVHLLTLFGFQRLLCSWFC